MTVQRYALVDGNDVVVSLTNWNGNTETWQPPEGLTAHVAPIELVVSSGWLWNGGSPVDPNPPAEPPAPDNSAAEMQAQRERRIDDTIEKLGKGTNTDRLKVIEDGIRLLL